MSAKKTYAVFGLGRYGSAVANELVKNGAEVIAVDINESAVNNAATTIPVCKCADVTDKEVIRQLSIKSVDVVIIAMASNLEVSVMATVLCKEAGVPEVIVKCGSDTHRKILLAVGADKVVFPENESGIRLAKNLLSSGFVDAVELSSDVAIVDIDVKDEWVGKSLVELHLRKKYDVNVVAILENGQVSVNIDPYRPLSATGRLVDIGNTEKLSKMTR
jgi:trk system potassium uptake protein TrkA